MNIHRKNNPNTEMQEQNEALIKKLQKKVVDSMTLDIQCNTVFQ